MAGKKFALIRPDTSHPASRLCALNGYHLGVLTKCGSQVTSSLSIGFHRQNWSHLSLVCDRNRAGQPRTEERLLHIQPFWRKHLDSIALLLPFFCPYW